MQGGIGIVASNATDSVLRLRQISLGIAVRKGVSHFYACLSFARARSISAQVPGRESEDQRHAPLSDPKVPERRGGAAKKVQDALVLPVLLQNLTG